MEDAAHSVEDVQLVGIFQNNKGRTMEDATCSVEGFSVLEKLMIIWALIALFVNAIYFPQSHPPWLLRNRHELWQCHPKMQT